MFGHGAVFGHGAMLERGATDADAKARAGFKRSDPMTASNPNESNPGEPDPDFDPDATVSEGDLDKTMAEEDANQTILEQDADQTVVDETVYEQVLSQDPVVEDTDKTVVDDDSDKTLIEDNLDATLAEDASALTFLDETVDVKTFDAINLDETSEAFSDVSGNRDEQREDQDATIDVEDDQSTAILASTNLEQTINPKALSQAESEYWNGISGEFAPPGHPTSMPPAIDRTIVETRLQLRSQSVSTALHGDPDAADYRLVRLLGRGGMGNVFVARQGSLDRLIAVKVIRPLEEDKKDKLAAEGKLEKVEQSRRQQFLTEAVVTGDLDHPNIVPIHDVAVTGDSTLFYSMKRVVGTPWSDVIQDRPRDENIEILIKVADAIGFAHTRGVIHRDIKPENVMLGDFGVVMVMDWGIALAKPEFEKLDSITPATGLGGTPSMMAPEMVVGPIEKIGPAADIYLLGATLFMIITGKPPHHATNVSMCLRAVATNEIRDYDPKHNGELMAIALKAMATNPQDRHADVKEFQNAIREYRSHSESIALATRANNDLQDAIERKSYSVFARSQFGFEEAIALWPGNAKAIEGLRENRIAHANAAYINGDYDIGLAILSPDDPEHADLIAKLKEALRLRQQREARFGLLKKVAAALLAFIFVGGSAAVYAINQARTRAAENAGLAKREAKIAAENQLLAIANEEKAIANEQRANASEREALENFQLAENNRALAVKNAEAAKQNADAARESARQAQSSARQARLAQNQAEYESYVSKIGLAKARMDRNEFSEARRLLSELTRDASNPQALPWEIRYLSSLANQSAGSVSTPASVVEVAMSGTPGNPAANQNLGLVLFDDGSIASTLKSDSSDLVAVSDPVQVTGDRLATAIAMSQDGRRAIIGLDSGDVLVHSMDDLSAPAATTCVGHRDRITRLQMLDEKHFISSSSDRTVRIWNLDSSSPIETLWHIGRVVDVSAQRVGKRWMIAAAVSERRGGQVVMWTSALSSQTPSQRMGFYSPHDAALTCVAVSPDGVQVASGDTDGHVMVWPVSEVRQRDMAALVKRAVESATATTPQTARSRIDSIRDSAPKKNRMPFALVKTRTNPNDLRVGSANVEPQPAHSAAVRRVRFSSLGGEGADASLVSCGDDYLVSVWQQKQSPTKTQWNLNRQLRGHGGPVADAVFIGKDKVLSSGMDQSIRRWTLTATDQDQLIGDGAFRKQVHKDAIWAAAFSSNGKRLATASRDRTAKLFTVDADPFRFQSIASLSDEESPASGSSYSNNQLSKTLTEGSPFRAMSMRMTADQRTLFVGGADSLIRIWDVRRGTELEQLSGTGLSQILAVSPDGKTLLTGASQAEVNALIWKWDPKSGQASIAHRLRGHQETVAAVAIAADGKTGMTGDRAGRLIVWDLVSGKPVGRPNDVLLGTRINDIAIEQDGQHAWIAADNGRLTRVSLRTGKVAGVLELDGFVTQVRLSDDGRYALTISELQKVKETIHRASVWRLSRVTDAMSFEDQALSKTLAKITVKSGARTQSDGRPGIASIDFRSSRPSNASSSSMSRAVVAFTPAGDGGSQVAVWNIGDDVSRSVKELQFGLPNSIGDVSSIIAHADDELISLHGSSAYRWNTRSGSLNVSYRAHSALTSVAFSDDAEIVATGSRSLKLWNANTGDSLAKLESPHKGTIRSIVFLAKSDQEVGAEDLFLTAGDDAEIRKWRFDREKQTMSPLGNVETDVAWGNTLSLCVSPDGRSLLSTTDRGAVLVHDLANPGKPARLLLNDPSIGRIHAGCFSADGNLVAVGGQDRLVRIWNLSQDEPPVVCQGHAESIQAVAFTGELATGNSRVLSAGQDGSIRVWDPFDPTEPTRGRELLELVGHEDGITSLGLNPSETMMMTAGLDGQVILWPAQANPAQANPAQSNSGDSHTGN